MPIYEKPTKTLMREWASENLRPNQEFYKGEVVAWFKEHYPKIKSNTVQMHVEGMAINNHVRKHHPNIRSGTSHDLFYKLGSNRFRLWNQELDPAPKYKSDFEAFVSTEGDHPQGESESPDQESGSEFAYENDLRNFLLKNLEVIEPGLSLYEEEGITGVEYPVGRRFIDILATDEKNNLVVIELKVSRGYDRVIGQIMRYMTWIEDNLASSEGVRGIIVANEITDDLRMAAKRISDVQLVEYEIFFKLKEVEAA